MSKENKGKEQDSLSDESSSQNVVSNEDEESTQNFDAYTKKMNEKINKRDQEIENLQNKLQEQINLYNNILLLHQNENEVLQIEIKKLKEEIEKKNEEIENFVMELFKTRESLELKREEEIFKIKMSKVNKGKRQDSFSDEPPSENEVNNSKLISENKSTEERNLEKTNNENEKNILKNDEKLKEDISYENEESTKNFDAYTKQMNEKINKRDQEIENLQNKLQEQINLYKNILLLHQNENGVLQIEIEKLKEEIENKNDEMEKKNEEIEIKKLNEEIREKDNEIRIREEEIQNFVFELLNTREALEHQIEENSKLFNLIKIIYEIYELKNMIRNSESSSETETSTPENFFIQNHESFVTQSSPEWLCHVLINIGGNNQLNSNALTKVFEILNKLLDLLKDDQLILINQLLSDVKDDKLLAKYQLLCRLISLQPQRKLELFGIFIRDLENLIKGTDENVLDKNFQIENIEMYSTIKSILEMANFNVPEVIDLDTIKELKTNLIE